MPILTCTVKEAKSGEILLHVFTDKYSGAGKCTFFQKLPPRRNLSGNDPSPMLNTEIKPCPPWDNSPDLHPILIAPDSPCPGPKDS